MKEELTLADYDERVGIYKTRIKNFVLENLALSRQFNHLTIKEVSNRFDEFYSDLLELEGQKAK